MFQLRDEGRLRFAPPPAPPETAKPKREPKTKVKIDPQLVAKARELRDRYLEHVNSDPHALRAVGKYAVEREFEAARTSRALLPLTDAA